jgi:hypothetical protein
VLGNLTLPARTEAPETNALATAMTQLTIVLMMLTGMLTMLDWRKGLTMCVLVGIAQDPLRKLAPGQPIYYVILVGVVFAIAWIRAALVKVPLTPSAIQGWRRNLKTPFSLFMLLVLAQALHSYVRYGSALMTGIGLLVWLAPIPAVMMGYQFAKRRGLHGVKRWMLLYCVVASLALSGVYLEYAGYDWRSLGEVGEGQILYTAGGAIKSHSGFFRSSETAAWHTATIACFAFLLFAGKRLTVPKFSVAVALITVLVTLGILTGRRKMLIEIMVFISVYFFFVAWLQRGMARLAMVLLIMGAIGYIGIVGFVDPDLVSRPQSPASASLDDDQPKYRGYAERGKTVFADLPARVNQLGVQPIEWAIYHHGFMGAGLGTGSQGTGNVAEAQSINRGAAEGGLGKVVMELGVPGLFMVAWLIFALGKHLRQQIAATARLSAPHARQAYGLIAFLVANTAAFSVATQAYSDLFILLMLGWALGFLLAMPVLAASGDTPKRRKPSQYSPFGRFSDSPTPAAIAQFASQAHR